MTDLKRKYHACRYAYRGVAIVRAGRNSNLLCGFQLQGQHLERLQVERALLTQLIDHRRTATVSFPWRMRGVRQRTTFRCLDEHIKAGRNARDNF